MFEGLKGISYAEQDQAEIKIRSVEILWKHYSFEKSEYKWPSEVYEQLDFSTLPGSRD